MLKNNLSKRVVKFICQRKGFLTLFADCITSSDTSYPYGDIPDYTISCPSNGSAEITVTTQQANTVVSASLIHFRWQIKNIQYNL